MLVRDLLKMHDSVQFDGAIPEILGDAYLLKTNPIYRGIRRQTEGLGADYVEAYSRYLLMPFYELSQIILNQKIPFVPHARLLRELEDKRPGVFTFSELRLPESYHMHEAAHVVADAAFKGAIFKTPEERILKAILCESFANTVDALSNVYAEEDLHRLFLQLNCYMKPVEIYMVALKRLIEAVGLKGVVQMTLFAYLHSNFLKDGVLSDLPPGANENDMVLLIEMAEELDPQFRVSTTSNYLKLEGFEGEILDLLNFPFMKVFAANSSFGRAVANMVGFWE